MSTRRVWLCANASVAALIMSPVIAAQTGALASVGHIDFCAAQALYKQGHWQIAFRAFACVADRAHPAAARIAVLLSHHGVRLYGGLPSVPEGRLSTWITVAVAAASNVRSRLTPKTEQIGAQHCRAVGGVQP
jgi:hypothetical protein